MDGLTKKSELVQEFIDFTAARSLEDQKKGNQRDLFTRNSFGCTEQFALKLFKCYSDYDHEYIYDYMIGHILLKLCSLLGSVNAFIKF
jgi:hypothetical protein